MPAAAISDHIHESNLIKSIIRWLGEHGQDYDNNREALTADIQEKFDYHNLEVIKDLIKTSCQSWQQNLIDVANSRGRHVAQTIHTNEKARVMLRSDDRGYLRLEAWANGLPVNFLTLGLWSPWTKKWEIHIEQSRLVDWADQTQIILGEPVA